MMSNATVTLDVRPDLRAGRDPFSRIMATTDGLKDGETLRLLAPFEPVPLFHVMAKRGFSHEARPTPTGDWEVLFERSPGATPTPEETPATSQSPRGGPTTIEVDARGLEPPQPLVVILEALAGLPEDAQLRARTERRPLHLYDQLEARGFFGETEEGPDGSFITTIRRA